MGIYYIYLSLCYLFLYSFIGGTFIWSHSIVFSDGCHVALSTVGQMRGDRPMRVAKCGAAAQLSC
jgi:hypothetical protein